MGARLSLVEHDGQDSPVVLTFGGRCRHGRRAVVLRRLVGLSVRCEAVLDATDPDATDPIAAEIGAVHIDSQGRPGSSRAVRRQHRRTGGVSARIWAGPLPRASEVVVCRTYGTPTVSEARRGASELPVRGQAAMIPGAPRPTGVRDPGRDLRRGPLPGPDQQNFLAASDLTAPGASVTTAARPGQAGTVAAAGGPTTVPALGFGEPRGRHGLVVIEPGEGERSAAMTAFQRSLPMFRSVAV